MKNKKRISDCPGDYGLTHKGRLGMWLMAKTGMSLPVSFQVVDDPTFRALVLRWLVDEGLVKDWCVGVDNTK